MADSKAKYEPTGSSTSYILRFGLIMLIGLGTLAWIGRRPTSIAKGEPLPPLDLQPLINAESISNDSLEGKVSVIHFWGTWCYYCKLEFPDFAELYEKYGDDERFEIISVSCSPGPEMDTEKLADDTRKFLEDYVPEMPTYCDTAGMTRGQVGFLLSGSLGYPTTLIVGPDGKIAQAYEGARGMKQLVNNLDSFLDR